MRHYLKEGDVVSLACFATINAEGKLDLREFDTENDDMYHDGIDVKQDKDGRFYYDYE
jgi:hypothetical protein